MVRSQTETQSDASFFAELPELSDFAEVTDPKAYADAPVSWQVVLTDVRGSTRAIESGRYRDVNALGVASIVAVCNALPNVELPYVFGGDGATLLIPRSGLAEAMSALRGISQVAKSAYDLELRTGVVPIADLAREGHAIKVARFRASPHVCLAMFAGSGFARAESYLKDPEHAERFSVHPEGDAEANLEGFECRWQPVASRKGFIVSLLIQARGTADEKAEVYRRVLNALEELSDPSDSRPVTLSGLKLRAFGGDYSSEARLRAGAASGAKYDAALDHARKKARIGRVLIGLGASAGGFDGSAYPRELVQNTDFRKFDETLRMVLDLAESEVQALEGFLEEQRQAQRLFYGVHRANAALVTCFVRSYAGNHLHFVDGANGGYALAAKQLKAQIKAD